MTDTPKQFRIRSFEPRNGRMTDAQKRAYVEQWPHFGLNLTDGRLNWDTVFGRTAPRFLEIGFGTGQSLLALAKQHPEYDIIGVEPHKPGIGAVMLGIEMSGLKNLRTFQCDVIDVLEQCIPDESLDGIHIFFPDPWQKRRNHKRRLIQPAFVKLLLTKLKDNATLHLATDWEDYSVHMMRVLSAETGLTNRAGVGQFAGRSPFRPIETKFERRALREGRGIWELQFYK